MRSVARSSALGLLCGLLVAGLGSSTPDSAKAAEPAVATDARLGGQGGIPRSAAETGSKQSAQQAECRALCDRPHLASPRPSYSHRQPQLIAR